MQENSITNFIEILDKRISKKLKDSKYIKRYYGKISNYYGSSSEQYYVKIFGGDTEFLFKNHTGMKLKVGDNVCIETVGTDLNTGFITQSLQNDHFLTKKGNWIYERNGNMCKLYTTVNLGDIVLDQKYGTTNQYFKYLTMQFPENVFTEPPTVTLTVDSSSSLLTGRLANVLKDKFNYRLTQFSTEVSQTTTPIQDVKIHIIAIGK